MSKANHVTTTPSHDSAPAAAKVVAGVLLTAEWVAVVVCTSGVIVAAVAALMISTMGS
jgi:hypothetical protein